MVPSGSLTIATGIVSERGKRPDNQDFAAVYLGTPLERVNHGIVAAVADGVGGAKGGRVASELAVRSLIDGYYCQPDTIGVTKAACRVIDGFNRWLNAQGQTDPRLQGAATTFTAVILRGRRAHILHAGDSRAWHYRDGTLTLLTDDHVLPQPDLRHVLFRAIGIEPHLRLDERSQPLAEHDRILITSDGIHGSLSDKALAALLERRGSAEADADAIVQAALAAGSQDNATAVLIDIVSLPAPDQVTISSVAEGLPIPPPPHIGESVDGYRLESLLGEGRYARLFLARDGREGSELVLKFPKPAVLSERGARLAFTREAIVGARVHSPFVAEVIDVPRERQSRLYVAMPFYAGETLERRLSHPLTIAAGVSIAARLTRGVAALHRLNIVHRDIKPENVILTEDEGLRLIDLGVARLPKLEEFVAREIPGTPSYMAPELYDGELGSEATDQFALGVTLYRMFTGRYPYGEVEPFSRPKFGKPVPPSRHRPDMPAWLEAALLRAIAVDPQERFGDVMELLVALEDGGTRAIGTPKPRSLYERNPLRFWQAFSLLLFVMLMIALVSR
ncbi:bifunctional protein-serine/threonine kinase/phosphatase [Rhizorhapis suberifaciens]|uniref:non-specific serine/threonine protein kinase n=1 Tax=Rhizorhapis suberifaciens TaxID=13656 RepID=A0A840HSY3_9SPHN|nr:bifunctional protein-serine/threonine kinase/phosphatase [Rhizorhapis suberifaciens]MBB4640719.1 serine/threonine protein phosphatase PrpC [Rhizorhapis suberifaciens]